MKPIARPELPSRNCWAILLGAVALTAGEAYWLGTLPLPVLLGNAAFAALSLLVRAARDRTTRPAAGKKRPTVADSTLQIANATLPYMRQGLTQETAGQIAAIIQKISDVPAVAITDTQTVLAFLGEGCEYHPPGGYIVTNATKEVVRTGRLRLVENQEDFDCPRKDCACPLGGAVITPLVCRGETVGTVKLYKTTDKPFSLSTVKLAAGLSQLLGMQLELAELDRLAQLATKAELDALQAQINPHFLFNTLNTIGMFTRTNADIARDLLFRLAAFLRHSLRRRGALITLQEEIEYVRNYLALEQARFKDKIKVDWNIDNDLLEACLPVLTVQPLVENAVRHGIIPKTGSGHIAVAAASVGGRLLITVDDDGVGIPAPAVPRLFLPGSGSGNGVALNNIQERIRLLFGGEHGLDIESEPGRGTTVRISVPLVFNPPGNEVSGNEAESAAR
ncbi:MAG: histidine kinase [bacterium]